MNGGVLTHKEYEGLRGELADSSSRFDSAERWQPDIQQNQVRLKFLGFLNGF
jgi:hypothetical protein